MKPTGIPPYYSPSLVADAILYVAEHPTRNYIVGDVGRVLDVLQRVSPPLVDNLLLLISFIGQRTNEPKTEAAPDNLFSPIQGYDKVEGDFGHLTIPSFTDWLTKNSLAQWSAIALGSLALGILAVQAFKNGEKFKDEHLRPRAI